MSFYDNLVNVYAMGLVHCSVCAPREMPAEDVVARVNNQHPTGIVSQWKLDPSETFSSGRSNPCPCDHDSDRLHYLLVC